MVIISESVHPRSLDFANQRKVVILRDQGYTCRAIARRVVNLQGEATTAQTVSRTITAFSRKIGRRRFGYHRCGRKPWKLTSDVQKFLIRRLLQLRKKQECTCATLQQVLARERG